MLYFINGYIYTLEDFKETLKAKAIINWRDNNKCCCCGDFNNFIDRTIDQDIQCIMLGDVITYNQVDFWIEEEVL